MSEHDDAAPSWEHWVAAGTTEEHRRLQLIERAYDEYTIAHLERTGVSEGWRCLEVGAGAGSIAMWLARRAGAGNVTATELFPHYLSGAAEVGVRVLRHDLSKDAPIGGEFDLIHGRAVLEHVQARDQAVERLASWLAPGGWLVLEDTSCVPAIAARPVIRRVMEVWMEQGATMTGSNTTWSRTFPLPLERAGLVETSAEVSVPVMRGGSPLAAALGASLRLAGPAMVASGSFTSEELEEACALYADPSYVDYSFQLIVAWGRRPQT